MRTAVTGGAGFIGSHLTEALLSQGHEVVCVERPGANRGWAEGLSVEWYPIGLEDPGLLRETFSGVDAVFHLAGLTEARRPSEFYRVNTEGTARVLEAAAQRDRAPRVILLSSLAAVGPCRNGNALSAETVPYPISHYGNSKLLAEAVVHAYADRVPTCVFRLASVYGPRERALLTLFKLIRHGVAITVGSWDRQVSVIHVGDVVQALVAASTRDQAVGRTYTLAHPDIVTWREFALAVGEAVGRTPRFLRMPGWGAQIVACAAEGVAAAMRRAAVLNRGRVRELEQERWVCDPGPAMSDLAFAPRFPLSRGVHETAAWYRRMQWL